MIFFLPIFHLFFNYYFFIFKSFSFGYYVVRLPTCIFILHTLLQTDNFLSNILLDCIATYTFAWFEHLIWNLPEFGPIFIFYSISTLCNQKSWLTNKTFFKINSRRKVSINRYQIHEKMKRKKEYLTEWNNWSAQFKVEIVKTVIDTTQNIYRH